LNACSAESGLAPWRKAMHFKARSVLWGSTGTEEVPLCS
jgi:hypothetical protein